jgi:hypothetical protein
MRKISSKEDIDRFLEEDIWVMKPINSPEAFKPIFYLDSSKEHLILCMQINADRFFETHFIANKLYRKLQNLYGEMKLLFVKLKIKTRKFNHKEGN